MVFYRNPHALTLQSCALVCKDWYYYTWFHLRRRVLLRDRNDVLALCRTLRETPRVSSIVQQVTISGHRSLALAQHLGTFAAMLAGKLPGLSRITIRDTEWTVGSIRMQVFNCLTTFRSVHTLHLNGVTVPSIAHLARIISALPGLRKLSCCYVDCSQEYPVSLAPLPLNSAYLEELEAQWVAPEIEDLLVRISQASRVRVLDLGLGGDRGPDSPGSRSQDVLDACAASLEVLRLHMDPYSSVDSQDIDSIVVTEQHYNLSRHERLWRLEIYYPSNPFVHWSWILPIISRTASKHLIAMSVAFRIPADRTAYIWDRALTMMKEGGFLVQLDDILQTEHFANIALRNICLGFYYQDWLRHEKPFGIKSTLREQCTRWDELIRRSMPGCNGRGILTTTHTYGEYENWAINMDAIHEEAQGRKAETGGEAQ
ncbi:uncharacterized protein C8Q71DRAFT_838491 [Rhodofomes roseus]|uniref:Uncharacterized protein n=1 Tax=Rhodofomes roseus TaxID=34475 RepID=A0ABQ8KBB9_9APHY|nr:uncharacterized protein C8Q71DRAFT_838491 [Rhodofomes roseus]KAH9834156.1 hypothetical protein C8Q71DRAFT_838491 [Rhodofomes roseus]